MADQEFLASFAVEIDETGVTRLQKVLEENRSLAEKASAAFDAAASSIRTFAEEMGLLPDFSGRGITTEGMSGLGGLSLGLDLTQARKDLDAFIREAKKPVPLSGNGSGITSAGQSAYNSIKSIFSTPIAIRAKVLTTVSGGAGDGDGNGEGNGDGNGGSPRTAGSGTGNGDGTLQRMSAGGRFTRPTDVQVAEDGDAEYIIPVKKESQAVPLLRQLLSELSPEARESLAGGTGPSGNQPAEQQPAEGTKAEGHLPAESARPLSGEPKTADPLPAETAWPLTGFLRIADHLSADMTRPLTGTAGVLSGSDSLTAGTASIGSITQDNRTLSAPVNIQVHASGANAEQIGQRLYDTAERYLLRTLERAFE